MRYANSPNPSAKGSLYGKGLLYVAARFAPERSESFVASGAVIAYGDIFIADA